MPDGKGTEMLHLAERTQNADGSWTLTQVEDGWGFGGLDAGTTWLDEAAGWYTLTGNSKRPIFQGTAKAPWRHEYTFTGRPVTAEEIARREAQDA